MNGLQASLLGLLLCVVSLRISSAKSVKSGVCPPERFYNSKFTVQIECANDGDCTGNKKCCSDNGFKICKPPAEEREGSCPVNTENNIERCDDMCSSDSECATGSKCCLKGCKKTCLPTVEKVGSCGIEPACLVAERQFCDGDSGCPDSEKCCKPECTHKCMRII